MAEKSEQKVQLTIKDTKEITANTNETILHSLATKGILLESICGGHGTCGKCKIKVLSGQVVDIQGVTAKSEDDGSYLACKVYPAGNLILEKIGQAGVSAKGEIGSLTIPAKHRSPLVNKRLIKPVYPTLTENYSLQEMISKESGGVMPVDVFTLKELARIAYEKVEEFTLVYTSKGITGIESGDTTPTLYGVAFDIGSTTVAGMLLDVNKSKIIAAAAETNPQATFGADVISRIKAASTSEGLAQLSTIIRECLNNLISRLCSSAGIANKDIYLITVAGNSTMEHLLMSVSPASLTHSPYVQTFKYLQPLLPQELSLEINLGGRVFLLPNIASFVGADTVAAAIAMNQDITSKMTLLIDLGTNGELVLGNKDKLLVSSTAAGPAFEGAQLSCGMRATAGAIEDVTITEDVNVRTINNQRPVGICGSGVIKAIAELIRSKVITPSGRFVRSNQLDKLSDRLKERLHEKNDQREFVITWAKDSATGSDIVITQGDIRQIQLVKSSICTGSQILMEMLGVTPNEVEQVLIAGAFGSYIDLDSALTIGLLPSIQRSKVRAVGNAAGEGAAKVLMSENYLTRCQSIAGQATFIELANHEGFQSKFIENLNFPEVKNENE